MEGVTITITVIVLRLITPTAYDSPQQLGKDRWGKRLGEAERFDAKSDFLSTLGRVRPPKASLGGGVLVPGQPREGVGKGRSAAARVRGLPALLLYGKLPSPGSWGSPGICSFTQMPSICL